MKEIVLSVIVCTRNRAKLLEKCINSLLPQCTQEVELIIVDNQSTDTTQEVAAFAKTGYQKLIYAFEPVAGLSNARNKGLECAGGTWLLYVDDDAYAKSNLIERCLKTIREFGEKFDCVGGMYYGYSDTALPEWMDTDFGSKVKYADYFTECPYTIPSGGIVMYKKDALEKIGGFDSRYGMKGEEKNFGDETDVQLRLYRKGARFAFDPEMIVYHWIKPEYISLEWCLRRRYLEGSFFKNAVKENKFVRILQLVRSLAAAVFRRFPKAIIKLVTRRNYYWQNLVYEVLEPVYFYGGKVFGKSI